jgi:hypothetical protein
MRTKEAESASEAEPQYWELLAEADKNAYRQLKHDFSVGNVKRVRNNRLETFDEILEAIRTFAERRDNNDWRRFLVCGVCWMENAIAINTRQLRLLVAKCKSSINGSLQKMGYSTNMSHSESWKILFPYIPMLKDHFAELRQWTIRCKNGTQITPGDSDGDVARKIEVGADRKFLPEANHVELPTQETTGARRPSVPLKFRGKISPFATEDARPTEGTV